MNIVHVSYQFKSHCKKYSTNASTSMKYKIDNINVRFIFYISVINDKIDTE